MSHDIFCSYDWDHKDIVHNTIDRLEKEGFKVWIDKELKAGDDLFTSMAKAIRETKIFLAFISHKYCKSENCGREITTANTLKKTDTQGNVLNERKIIPCIYVMLDDVYGGQYDKINFFLSTTLRINAYKGNQWYIELVEALKKHMMSIKYRLQL